MERKILFDGNGDRVTFTQVGWLTGDGHFHDVENFRPALHLREGESFAPVFREGPNS